MKALVGVLALLGLAATADAFAVGAGGSISASRLAGLGRRRSAAPAAPMRMGFLGWNIGDDVGGKGIRSTS